MPTPPTPPASEPYVARYYQSGNHDILRTRDGQPPEVIAQFGHADTCRMATALCNAAHAHALATTQAQVKALTERCERAEQRERDTLNKIGMIVCVPVKSSADRVYEGVKWMQDLYAKCVQERDALTAQLTAAKRALEKCHKMMSEAWTDNGGGSPAFDSDDLAFIRTTLAALKGAAS